MTGPALSPAPYTLTDDGTVTAADGTVVCVMGAPFEALTDQDRVNAAPILVLPELLDLFAAMIRCLRDLRAIRPRNWADPDDHDQLDAWTDLDRLLVQAGFGET